MDNQPAPVASAPIPSPSPVSTQLPPAPSTSNPTPPRRSRKKIAGLVLLVLILIAAAAFGGYKFEHQRALKVEKNQQSQIDSLKKQVNASQATGSAKSTGSTTSVDPYANWKSYTSTTSGYTVKYPSTWIIEGYSTNTGLVATSQLNGSESSILLLSSNSKTNSFGLWISGDTGYKTSTDSDGSGFGGAGYSDGSIIKTLSNGMGIWEQSEQSTRAQQPNNPNVIPVFEVASNGQFGYKLKSGKYVQVSMGFGYAAKQSTTYSYAQQSSSSEIKEAENILSSLQ
ncbi:MAG TPA: hypothetical protein VHC21_02720 [Candidatus Saccharimonadales bacterium]|nr:hypothetical protein [Candidatus Saccharimonadales bacterium]